MYPGNLHVYNLTRRKKGSRKKCGYIPFRVLRAREGRPSATRGRWRHRRTFVCLDGKGSLHVSEKLPNRSPRARKPSRRGPRQTPGPKGERSEGEQETAASHLRLDPGGRRVGARRVHRAVDRRPGCRVDRDSPTLFESVSVQAAAELRRGRVAGRSSGDLRIRDRVRGPLLPR